MYGLRDFKRLLKKILRNFMILIAYIFIWVHLTKIVEICDRETFVLCSMKVVWWTKLETTDEEIGVVVIRQINILSEGNYNNKHAHKNSL